MTEVRKQSYLWGVWFCWGMILLAFELPTRMTLFLSLAGTAVFCLLFIESGLHTKRMILKVFNLKRKDEDKDIDTASPAVKMQQANPLPLSSNDEHSTKETVISLGSVLAGEITNENNITINGVVEGDITSQKTTQIGKEGRVTGKVTSLKLVVNGVLKGSCYARTVIIMSRGRIDGEVYAGEFSIEKGGVFVGNSHQTEEPAAVTDKKDKKLEPVSVLAAVEKISGKNSPVSDKK